MNERIKQLAEQAFIITTDGKIGHVNTYMVEKFAELIVGECMEQVWYTREDYINENISDVIKERMAKHFGVEE